MMLSLLRGTLLACSLTMMAVAGAPNARAIAGLPTMEDANQLITNAGSQGRGIAQEAGQTLLNAIAALKASGIDLIGAEENTLTAQQQQLLSNIRATVALLQDPVHATTAQLQQSANTLALSISNLPGGKDIPRVTKIAPLYSVDAAGMQAEFVVQGLGLSNGKPFLEVEGSSSFPDTTTDTEIRFAVPAHGVATTKPTIIKGVIHLFERKGRWFFSSALVSHDYPVLLFVYPQLIGQLQITARRNVVGVENTSKQSVSYRCQSGHGGGSASTPVTIVPTPGYTLSGVQYVSEYSNHGRFVWNSTSSAGYTGSLFCSGFGGNLFTAGNIGVEQGHFIYLETKPTSATQDDPLKSLDLHWGDSRVVSDLPPDTQAVIFRLMPFTGQTLELEGAGANQFAIYDYNPASKVASIKARDIDTTLRQ